MSSINKVPSYCPACDKRLLVKRLQCPSCETSVEGIFELPVLVQLSPSDLSFLLKFIKSSGSLKEMAKLTGHSYPKVRNTLDDIIREIEKLENLQEQNKPS
jgi:hypothetical protein